MQYFITHNLAIFYQCNPGFLVTNFRKNMNLRLPIWVQVSTVIISLRISWLADFFLLPKHYFLSWLPRFIRVLSKIEVIWVIASGGSKVADGYSSFFDNKWRREGFFESSNKLTTWRHNDVKLLCQCLDVGNEEYVILRNFGGRFMSSFEVIIRSGPPKPCPTWSLRQDRPGSSQSKSPPPTDKCT